MGQQNAESIFNAAREISSKSELNGYLAGSCGNDVGLRSKVQALLKADSEAGSFLHAETDERSSGNAGESGKLTMPFGSPREKAGQMIGRYKLLQPIGEGGFGSVWMAEQREPVKRRVALKIIKLGMDTKQVIARFDAERQALAMMDHPNIAKVLDAGATETGRPYFAMEYVKGIGILEYCDKEKLNPKARLKLFISVCNAIQHAHQKGIIHRDIKPSNVMITLHDGVPVPKVIDFGIAKATNSELTQKTLFTEHRQMIGTPAYMSPEQAEMSGLDIDTRSDIYSLGVLLYELLTGTTPFDSKELASKGYAEMLRIILETEPHKPSTRLSSLGETATQTAHLRQTDVKKLSSTLKGDLDWIVMKCLEKDRSRRYDTANGIAADIKRHLKDEPVKAGPPSLTYCLSKFLHRNRTAVAVASIVIVCLVAGLTVAVTSLSKARIAIQNETAAKLALAIEMEEALVAKKEAETQRDRAQSAMQTTEILRGILDRRKESIAVIPIEFISQDPEQEYLANGITVALTDELNKVKALYVAPTNSVYRLYDKNTNKQEIANALNVNLLVTGTAILVGDKVRIAMSLDEIASGTHYWEKEYNGTWNELFDKQSQVSQDIANEINIRLTKQDQDRLAKSETQNPKARNAYFKGVTNLRAAGLDDLNKAIVFFDEAIKLDPQYASAYVGKAEGHVALSLRGIAPKDCMQLAKDAVLKAIEIDKSLASAWAVLGNVYLLYDWNWKEAEKALKTALTLDPDFADAYATLGAYYVSIGEIDKAIQHIHIAVKLDPTTLLRHDATNYVPFMARDFDTVIELCNYAIDLDEEFWSPYAWMGLAMAWQGDIKGGIEQLEHSDSLETNPLIMALLASVYAMDGQIDKCDTKLEELIEYYDTNYVCPYEIAAVFIALDDIETAFRYLGYAVEAKSGCMPFLPVDIRMDGVRDNPEYRQIIDEINHPLRNDNTYGKAEDNRG